jgi:hypothetical protein
MVVERKNEWGRTRQKKGRGKEKKEENGAKRERQNEKGGTGKMSKRRETNM